MAKGATFVSYSADILMIKKGLAQMRAQFEPLGFAFDSSLPNGDKTFLYAEDG